MVRATAAMAPEHSNFLQDHARRAQAPACLAPTGAGAAPGLRTNRPAAQCATNATDREPIRQCARSARVRENSRSAVASVAVQDGTDFDRRRIPTAAEETLIVSWLFKLRTFLLRLVTACHTVKDTCAH